MDVWNRVALKGEQVVDHDLGQILQEFEAGQRPEWKNIAVLGPIKVNYRAQWKSAVLRDGVLERHWEGRTSRT